MTDDLVPALMPFDAVADLPLGEAALVYAQAGMPVVPCWPGSKIPATEHGFLDATTDIDQVAAWWAAHPRANIGLATGIVADVLDIDAHATGTGFPAVQRLHQMGLIGGWSHAVRSPSGGLHLYYPCDPKRPNQTWSRGRAHIDVRGCGGYIVTVPSRSACAAGGAGTCRWAPPTRVSRWPENGSASCSPPSRRPGPRRRCRWTFPSGCPGCRTG